MRRDLAADHGLELLAAGLGARCRHRGPRDLADRSRGCPGPDGVLGVRRSVLVMTAPPRVVGCVRLRADGSWPGPAGSGRWRRRRPGRARPARRRARPDASATTSCSTRLSPARLGEDVLHALLGVETLGNAVGGVGLPQALRHALQGRAVTPQRARMVADHVVRDAVEPGQQRPLARVLCRGRSRDDAIPRGTPPTWRPRRRSRSRAGGSSRCGSPRGAGRRGLRKSRRHPRRPARAGRGRWQPGRLIRRRRHSRRPRRGQLEVGHTRMCPRSDSVSSSAGSGRSLPKQRLRGLQR